MSLIDGRTELLSNIDQETSDILLRQMRNRLKIHMCLGVEVESVHLEEHGVALNLKNRRQLKVDKVLYAAGRQSNTSALCLDVAGVATGKRGIITVNENYQTCVPHIYAAGDVIGFPALGLNFDGARPRGGDSRFRDGVAHQPNFDPALLHLDDSRSRDVRHHRRRVPRQRHRL
jgi:NAD(P) transhydrogenase